MGVTVGGNRIGVTVGRGVTVGLTVSVGTRASAVATFSSTSRAIPSSEERQPSNKTGNTATKMVSTMFKLICPQG